MKKRIFSKEWRQKLSIAHKGVKLSNNHKQRISTGTTGEKNPFYGKHHSEETRQKLSNIQTGRISPYKGKKSSEETKLKLSLAAKKRWRNEEYRQKMQEFFRKQSLNAGINKSEQKLLNILLKIDTNFKFIGDRIIWINGKNPDFINEEKKLIVEYLGEYWHRNDTEDDLCKRASLFGSEGYSTLFIWEKELKDSKKLTNRLEKFSK